MKNFAPVLVLAVVTGVGAGCTRTESCEVSVPEEIDPTGATHTWIVDSVALPDTAQEAFDFALDLDHDELERGDNAIGQILSVVFSEFDVGGDAVMADMIADGRILHLLELRATDLRGAAGVGARLHLGRDSDDDPSDNFSGDEMFAVVDGRPTEPMSGAIVDGQLDVELGVVSLRIAFPDLDEPFDLVLDAARVVAEVSADRISGVLAGGISIANVDAQLLPAAYAQIAYVVARDCPSGSCEADSSGARFVELFDADADAAVSYEEFTTSSAVTSLVRPDVDLFQEDGRHSPSCDGVDDSLSVGVAFTAVPARFEPPPRQL